MNMPEKYKAVPPANKGFCSEESVRRARPTHEHSIIIFEPDDHLASFAHDRITGLDTAGILMDRLQTSSVEIEETRPPWLDFEPEETPDYRTIIKDPTAH